MTITPYDFPMLMGIGFVGEPLVYQESFYAHGDQLFHLLGRITESILYEDRFSYSILVDLINDDEQGQNIHLSSNLASFWLSFWVWPSLLILGNRCHFRYLLSLVDLNKVRTWIGKFPCIPPLLVGCAKGCRKPSEHMESNVWVYQLWAYGELLR